nr:ARID DNA-binding domain-containing protein [Tanacetum cinerariifolium]
MGTKQPGKESGSIRNQLNVLSVKNRDTLQTRVHKSTLRRCRNKKRRRQPPYHHCPNQKKGEALSNEWEEHRDKFNRVLTWFFNHFLMRPLPGTLPPIIKGVSIHLFDLYELIESMGGYISVQFENDFEGLAEVFGLERSDAFEIRRCYLDYLEPLVSNYKATRSSNPTGGYEDEGIRRFKDYHGDGNIDGSTAAKEKGKVEHFGITLEKEEEGKYDATAHQDMARIKCPNKDQRPTNGASRLRLIKEEDTQSSSSGDFTIIT